MKGGKEHKVLLSKPALAMIDTMREVRQNGFVFPARRSHPPSFHAARIYRQPKKAYPAVHQCAQREPRSSAHEHYSFSWLRPRIKHESPSNESQPQTRPSAP